MKKVLYIYNNVCARILLLVVVLLAACSEDADDHRLAGPDDEDVLQLGTIGQAETVDEGMQTRAVPSGYTEYTGGSSIGVFLTKDNTAPEQVSTFSYREESGWFSLVTVKTETYYIYGFMPANLGTYSISLLPLTTSYSQGARLSLTGMKSVLSEDACIISGVKGAAKETAAEEAASLRRGSFVYQGQTKGNNYVNLMLDHLYCAVRFLLKVGDEYSNLRVIKLKELKIKALYCTNVSLTMTLTPNTTGADPISNPVWNYSGGSDEAVLFYDANGLELTNTVDPTTAIQGYFPPIPDVGRNLSITCTYDVYDKNGNLVRENCEAVNRLPQMTPGRGNRLTLTLTVKPTYLYVLSEPDLDNPTVSIE